MENEVIKKDYSLKKFTVDRQINCSYGRVQSPRSWLRNEKLFLKECRPLC